MPPERKYFITAKIGVMASPVSLGYYKGFSKEIAIQKAKINCPLTKDAYLFDYEAIGATE